MKEPQSRFSSEIAFCPVVRVQMFGAGIGPLFPFQAFSAEVRFSAVPFLSVSISPCEVISAIVQRR